MRLLKDRFLKEAIVQMPFFLALVYAIVAFCMMTAIRLVHWLFSPVAP